MANGSRLVKVLGVGLLGGVGGAVNAALCWARLPAPVPDFDRFAWTVVPAGAWHGAVLALLPFAAAAALARRPLAVRLLAAPLVGWITGWIAWIPLERVVLGKVNPSWVEHLVWPFERGSLPAALWMPFAYFGLVALLWYLAHALPGARRAAALAMAGGLAAGVLGSLWWWILWRAWWFAPLHGAIWGALVGLGAARAGVAREPEAAPSAAAPAA